jgi:hypothetical protein
MKRQLDRKIVVNGLPDDPIADVVTGILDAGGEAIPLPALLRSRGPLPPCAGASRGRRGDLQQVAACDTWSNLV